MTTNSAVKGSIRLADQGIAPMRKYFAPDSLTFFDPSLVEEANLRFPVYLNIEPTMHCNANCIMCPRSQATRPVGNMSFTLFRRIIDDIIENGPTQVITFHKEGEPLLNPYLEDMIALARHSGACEFTHFNTNALLLNSKRAERLLQSGIQDITMSVDAVTEETFQHIKGVPSLKKVENNILNFINLRNSAGLTEPWIRVKMVKMKETESELQTFIKRWTGYADEVQIQEVHNYGGGVKRMQKVAERYPCQAYWYTLAINWDGTVCACSVDYDGAMILGDVSRQGIKDVFHSQVVQKIRQEMLNGEYGTHPICRDCLVWQVGPDQSEWYRKIQKISDN